MYDATAELQPAPLHTIHTQTVDTQGLRPSFAWRVLEEIDYGLMVVGAGGELQHANHLARQELGRERFMRMQGGRLQGQTAWHGEELLRGIQRAAQGRREMIVLRNGEQSLHVACVPLFHAFEEGGSVLLMLGRQNETHNLAITFFSRSHGLTPAEEAVLKALCDGLRVPEIASARGVSENTVRTHVRALRDKTGIHSIRGMIQRIAALPPVVPLSLSMAPRAAPHNL
jgi:DNA-binding CsgD family transcriptional regulator